MGTSRRSAILLPGLLAAVAVGSRAADSVPSKAKAPTVSPPARTNLVEPLSNGLRLTQTKAQVLQQFGQPTLVTVVGMTFPEFAVGFDGPGEQVSHFRTQKGVRLACGVGVGDSMDRVQKVFPGGGASGGNYQVTHGQYSLLFEGYQNEVYKVSIWPVKDRFVDESAPPPPKPKDLPVSSLAGTWHMTQGGVGVVTLKADGSYTTGVGGKGTFTTDGRDVVFKGALEAWNGGRGTQSQDGVIEFHWKNEEGFQNYIVLIREGNAPIRDKR